VWYTFDGRLQQSASLTPSDIRRAANDEMQNTTLTSYITEHLSMSAYMSYRLLKIRVSVVFVVSIFLYTE